MVRERSRRRFLELAGAGTALALAGCAGTSDGATGDGTTDTSTDSPTTSSTTRTTTSASTETPTETPTETTTDEPTDISMSTVFHFSSDASVQKHAIANVSNLLADDTIDLGTVALVANGAGIKLLSTADSKSPDEVGGLVERGVEIKACQNSMDAFDLTKSDLIDGVEPVPSGVGELTKLQAKDGFAYIKTP